MFCLIVGVKESEQSWNGPGCRACPHQAGVVEGGGPVLKLGGACGYFVALRRLQIIATGTQKWRQRPSTRAKTSSQNMADFNAFLREFCSAFGVRERVWSRRHSQG